jgi:phage-related protein
MAVLWLKKQADIISEGDYAYNASSCFLLDANVMDIDLDTPVKKVDVRKKIGNGQYVRVTDFYDARNIKVNLKFKRDASGNNVFNADRLNILKTWVTSDDEIYLIRDYSTALQKIRVYPTGIGGEKYSNYVISGNISIEFLTGSPFFESITETTNDFSSTGGAKVCAVTNNGVKCPFKITIDLAGDSDGIIIKLFENVQLQLLDYFYSGDVIEIDMSTMDNLKNGALFLFDTNGSPFQLNSGVNNVTVTTNGSCDIDIDYYQRFL